MVRLWGLVAALLWLSLASAQFDDGADNSADPVEAGEQSSDSAPVATGPSRPIEDGDYKALSEGLARGSEPAILKAASNILGKDPNDLKALNGLAVFYIRTGKEGLAKIIIERALRSHPNEAALHNNLGVISLKEGDARKAIAQFRKALESNGNYGPAATNLASIYLEYRDFNRAIVPLEESYQAVRADVKKGTKAAVDIANNYAVALTGTGNPEKAKDVYEAIVAGDSRQVAPMLNYAILLIDVLKQKRDANRLLGKLKFISDDPKIVRKVEALQKRADELN